MRLLIRLGLEDAAARLHTIDPSLATQFLDTKFLKANLTDRFLVSCWGTLATRMRPLLTETVVRYLAHSDFTASELLCAEKPVSVYFRWKEQDLLALSPLVRLLWGTLINELTTTYDINQGNGCQPVLLLVDEADRTAIPMLADQATTVVGRGITLLVAIQSLEQLRAEYGEPRAQVLIENKDSQIFYPPNALATAQYISDCLGRISAFAHSTISREGGETSVGLSEQGIPLMTAQDIKQIKDEEIIGFHRHLPPFMMKRVDWRHHPLLKQRCSISSPEIPTLPQIVDIPASPGESQIDRFADPDEVLKN